MQAVSKVNLKGASNEPPLGRITLQKKLLADIAAL